MQAPGMQQILKPRQIVMSVTTGSNCAINSPQTQGDGSASSYAIIEGARLPPDELGGSFVSTFSDECARAIIIEAGEEITCTVTNTIFPPTP